MSSEIKKKIIFAIATVIIFVLIMVIGPIDGFFNGYFCDNQFDIGIAGQDLDEPFDFSEGDFLFSFKPEKRHLQGFEILLTNQVAENDGYLIIEIKDENDKLLEKQEIPLEDIDNEIWYKIYTQSKYDVDWEYNVFISVEGADNVPSLITIDRDYLSEEITQGNAAIVLAYAHSTFSYAEKALFIIALIGIWFTLLGYLLIEGKRKKVTNPVAVLIFLTIAMAWVFMFNSLDNINTTFTNFQIDSETLVSGVIVAEEKGIWFEKESELGYGLGRFYSDLGQYSTYTIAPYNNGIYIDGYHKSEPWIAVNDNQYTKKLPEEGAAVRFSNGEQFFIVGFEKQDGYIFINLSADRGFNKYKYGDIEDAVFIMKDGTEIRSGSLSAYSSQYGLQGKIYRHLARLINYEIKLEVLHLLNSLATALILTLIVLLISVKYNKVLASIFYVTFLLSPWVVNFGRNLYWVEFTWFIPMLVGLICLKNIENRRLRILSYIMAWASIAIKSLCGYEYISTVMMGLIAFILIELIVAILERNKRLSILLFRTTIIIGVAALIGFITAISIHATLRGEGSILEGIHDIIERDVLRRTNGGSLNDFDEVYWPSLNASTWEVFCKYFKFSTEIIAGITGNLFPILCIMPLLIFLFDIYKKIKINARHVAAYVVFFMTTISWICLAKGHSYIHTHMNYVLWYFGFIQICFYIIISRIKYLLDEIKDNKTES